MPVYPSDFAVAGLTLAWCYGSLILGRALGRRARQRAVHANGPLSAHVGVTQAALLGLLALLLSFSYAGAKTRFLDRQSLIVREANAIGTAHLRADLLDEPHRSALRMALGDYATRRAELIAASGTRETDELNERLEDLHARIWDAAAAGVAAKPSAVLAVLPPVNEVIDLHGERKATARLHLPAAVVAMLALTALGAITTVGMADSLTGERFRVFSTTLSLLIGCSLTLTFDLDNSRRGLVRVDPTAMLELRDRLAPLRPEGSTP